MDKHAMKAFEKMQKREHLIRVNHYRYVKGHYPYQVYKENEARIIEEFKLTDDERQAYEHYNKIIQQKKR